MSQVFRYVHGDMNPVVAAVESSTVIELGDLVFQDTDDAKPASDQSDAGTLIANQDLFKQNFLGVATQRSRSGDTKDITVATSGVFRFICAADTFELGDLVAPADGDPLANQTVISTAVVDSGAIGKVHQREGSAVTEVSIEIESTVMHGGVAEHTVGSGS